MTSQEERLYWIGFGYRASQLLGLLHGGAILAELVRAAPAVVRQGGFPTVSRSGRGVKTYAVSGLPAMVSHLRGALSDLGLDKVLHHRRGPYGDPEAGGYWLELEAALTLRALVEGRE